MEVRVLNEEPVTVRNVCVDVSECLLLSVIKIRTLIQGKWDPNRKQVCKHLLCLLSPWVVPHYCVANVSLGDGEKN